MDSERKRTNAKGNHSLWGNLLSLSLKNKQTRKHLMVQTVRYTVTEKLAAFETFNFAMDPERKRTLKATVVYGGSLSNPFVPRLSHPLIHIFQQVHFPCFHTIKKLI